jgi:hypothetical protein
MSATATRPAEPQVLETLAEREQKTRELAYLKWEEAGCPESDGVQFWLDAEAELAN